MYRSFWNVGNVSARDDGGILYKPSAGGAADWSQPYAITSFLDTKNGSNRRIQIGWSAEDNNRFGIMQNGYQGSLSLPRELFNLFTPNVSPPNTSTSDSNSTIGNSLYIRQDNGTCSALTLGARPLPRIAEGLRNGSTYTNFTTNTTTLTGSGEGNSAQLLTNTSFTS